MVCFYFLIWFVFIIRVAWQTLIFIFACNLVDDMIEFNKYILKYYDAF